MLARHVSDLIGPSSGAFFYKLYVQTWYVAILVLLDSIIKKRISCWTAYILQDDTRSLPYQIHDYILVYFHYYEVKRRCTLSGVHGFKQDMQCTYDMQARSRKYCYRGKSLSIKYEYVCVRVCILA